MNILAAAVLLALSLSAAYLVFIRPLGELPRDTLALLFLVSLTAAGGLLGSPLWWLDEEGAFSWDLPPLASRMLAAAGIAFFVESLVVLRWPSGDRLRLHLLLLAVYLAPLVAAIALCHLDRFDWGDPITWSFFLIAGTMTVSCLYFLARPPQAPLNEPGSLPGQQTRAWLMAVAAVTTLWGLALFATDDGFWDKIWVWPGDTLTSRLIGVMVLTIAAGSLWSLRSRAAATTMLAMNAAYGLGVCAANLWSSTQDKPVQESYVIVFGVIGLGSLLLLAVEAGLTRSRVAEAPA
jgi:hypothetical protein